MLRFEPVAQPETVAKSETFHEIRPWGRFHEKSQFETSFGLSLGLKSEIFVSAEFLAQIDFTKGDSAETGLKSWSQLLNFI